MRNVIEASFVNSTEKKLVFNVQVKQGFYFGILLVTEHFYFHPAKQEKTFIYCHVEHPVERVEKKKKKKKVKTVVKMEANSICVLCLLERKEEDELYKIIDKYLFCI